MKTFFRSSVKVILFLVFFEILLHLGGFVFLKIQDLGNISSLQPLKGKKEYTILCMGDSITGYGGENSYPRILARILNKRYPDMRFRVINKGIPARSSSELASYLPMFMDQYNPDMVTVMMGYQDLAYIRREQASLHERLKIELLQNIKIARFIKRLIDPLRPDLQKRLDDDTLGRKLWTKGDQQSEAYAGGELVNLTPQDLQPQHLGMADPKEQQARSEILVHPQLLTINSFNDFVEIVKGRGKQLVIMQYPRMDVAVLKKIIRDPQHIIFVENKANFDKALATSSPEYYFMDLITPLFGHCTPQGYELIAQNLAQSISQYIDGNIDR